LLVTLSFWPAILFVAPGLGAAIRRSGEASTRFLLAWAAACWLLVEIVPTKLPHYVLPAYPPLAMLAALWILAPRDANGGRWQPLLQWLAAIQFFVGLAALAGAVLVLPRIYGSGTTWSLIALATVGAVLALAALAAQLRGAALLAATAIGLAAIVLYPALTVDAGPRLDQLWVSERVAALVAKDAHRGDPPPVLAGYTEPSLVFLLGTDTRLTDGTGAAEVGAYQGGLALIEDSERSGFLAHLGEIEADAVPVDQLSGFNYSRGRKVHITLYRVTASQEVTVPPAE
jgi:4-amino-4-deoxy-L-arabinose transferase-like glycosyltransferase